MNIRSKAVNPTVICILLVIFAVATRVYPHPVSFTSVTAIGLFAGACISDRRFWLLPGITLLISDVIIGFYNPVVMLFVYLGFTVSVFAGRLFLYRTCTLFRLGCTTVISATVFFVISNMGVWLCGLYYPLNVTGLIECFILALPFFGNTLCGDLFYVVCLFGLFEAVQMCTTRKHWLRTA